jgi:hypothetical protein
MPQTRLIWTAVRRYDLSVRGSNKVDLSIIIVNWNSADYLKECLYSVLQETKNIEFEIIVVDNASYDAAQQMIEKEFPIVRFVQSHENGGFAKASNLGFRYSAGRNILFLNPDTRIIGPAIEVMLCALESTADAGAVGCRLLYPDLSLQTHSVQRYPTVLNQVLDIDFLKDRFPKWKVWGIKPLIQPSATSEEVEVVPGACVMVKRETFAKVGMFSEDYFMYAEDIDLCYKIAQTGFKVYFVSGAEVVHHGGASSRNGQSSGFQEVLMRESVSRFMAKTRGRAAAVTYRIAMSLSAVVRLLPVILLVTWTSESGPRERLLWTFNKWKKVLRWSVGLENWARDLR